MGSKQGKWGESLLVCAQGGKGFPMPKNPDCRCCTPSRPHADSCGQGLSGACLCRTMLLELPCRALPGQDRPGTVGP